MNLLEVSPFAKYLATFASTDVEHAPVFFVFLAVVVEWACIILPLIGVLSYLIRKLIPDIQMRIGPNRAGYFGLLQPLSDTIRDFFKETRNKGEFFANYGPFLILAFLGGALGCIPFSQEWIIASPEASVFLVLVLMLVVEILKHFVASELHSLHSFISAQRFLQRIAIAVVPTVLGTFIPAMLAGSANIYEIGNAQGGAPWQWFAFNNIAGPFGAGCLYLGLNIWIGTPPFDFVANPEEIKMGPVAFESGLNRLLSQVSSRLSILLTSSLLTTLYFGGWKLPFSVEEIGRAGRLVEYLFWCVKTLSLTVFTVWVSGTLPRLRVDQLKKFAWEYLTPISLMANILAVFWLFAKARFGI